MRDGTRLRYAAASGKKADRWKSISGVTATAVDGTRVTLDTHDSGTYIISFVSDSVARQWAADVAKSLAGHVPTSDAGVGESAALPSSPAAAAARESGSDATVHATSSDKGKERVEEADEMREDAADDAAEDPSRASPRLAPTALAVAQAGDVCGACEGGELAERRGIEVGHAFYLGTK